MIELHCNKNLLLRTQIINYISKLMSAKEYQEIMKRVYDQIIIEASYEFVQMMTIAIFCTDQNKFWRNEKIDQYLYKLNKKLLKQDFCVKVKHLQKTIIQLFPVSAYLQLNEVYDSFATRMFIDTLVDHLKPLQHKKTSDAQKVESFIAQLAIINFIYFYAQYNNTKDIRNKANIYLTQNRQLIKHCKFWFIKYKKTYSENSDLDNELKKSKATGESSNFSDLKQFIA